MSNLEGEERDISFRIFYSVIAEYLLKLRLIDMASFDDKHLVVNEIESGDRFEFILLVKCLKEKGEKSCTGN